MEADTHPLAHAEMIRMMKMRSPEERLRMACSMYDSAKAMITANLVKQGSTPGSAELKRQLVLRFYNDDLPASFLSGFFSQK